MKGDTLALTSAGSATCEVKNSLPLSRIASKSSMVQPKPPRDRDALKMYYHYIRNINFEFLLAGDVSLPDCVWYWERGNKFPINEYGTFRILLYDAYGNKISGATGAVQPNVQVDALFPRSEINSISMSETISETPPTTKISWQMAFGFCIISVYAKKVGTFRMLVRDHRNITLGNMPTTFYVTPGFPHHLILYLICNLYKY